MSGVLMTLHDSSGNNVSAIGTFVEETIIKFTPDDDILTGDAIRIQFDGFDMDDVVLVDDATITQANGGDDMVITTADIQNPTVNPTLRAIIDTQSDNPDGEVTITLINNHVLTPASADTYKITLAIWDLGDDEAWGGAGADADSVKMGSFGAVVIGTNQVQITGNVDPTLTLTLSDTTCGLGTLALDGLATCEYDSEVSTNADSGYTAYIKADGNLRNATNSITNVADGTVGVTNSGGISTEEEYGVSTTNASATIAENDSLETCGDLASQLVTAMPASALTTSDQSFATADAPVSADSTTLCHAAVITGTTPAGVYAQVVTITVVGNF
jgi:hypothetical protein